MFQPLNIYHLPNSVMLKLSDNGILYKEDLSDTNSISVVGANAARENISKEEHKFNIGNALDIWQIENALPSIPTFSQALDQALGTNGIALGSITQVCGLPGTGKTQLCLQLCADVQVPVALGGLDAEAIFIDTNTNFTWQRMEEIMEACYAKCTRLLGKETDCMPSIESHLKRIHYVDAFGMEKFCAALHNLTSFLGTHHRVKLVVIDSIVFPFKDGFPDNQKTGLLYRAMATLQKLALDNRIAVVLVNEMTTRLGLVGEQVVAGLGDSWAHRPNTHIVLAHHAGNRVALLEGVNARGVVPFQITQEGIRDIK